MLIYAQPGNGRRASLFTDYTFGVWDGDELVPVAKAYSGLTDEEIRQVDAFVRRNTIEKFGPVRAVKPELVFELAFEGMSRSPRHKSGHRRALPAHGALAHRQAAARPTRSRTCGSSQLIDGLAANSPHPANGAPAGISLSLDSFTVGGEGWGEGRCFVVTPKRQSPPHPALSPGCAKERFQAVTPTVPSRRCHGNDPAGLLPSLRRGISLSLRQLHRWGEGSSVHPDRATTHCHGNDPAGHLPFSVAGISLSPDSFTVGGEGWGEGAFEFAPSRRRAKPPHPALSPGAAGGEGSNARALGTDGRRPDQGPHPCRAPAGKSANLPHATQSPR